jgi:hypothetical protein
VCESERGARARATGVGRRGPTRERVRESEGRESLRSILVRKGGLEPPLDCSNKLLRLARLPIPPLPRRGMLPQPSAAATSKYSSAANLQTIADAKSRPLRGAGGHLNSRKRREGRTHASGSHGRPHLDDASIARDVDDVDRKLHPKGVHSLTRSDDKSVAGRQSGPAEQASRARLRVEGRFEIVC